MNSRETILPYFIVQLLFFERNWQNYWKKFFHFYLCAKRHRKSSNKCPGRLFHFSDLKGAFIKKFSSASSSFIVRARVKV